VPGDLGGYTSSRVHTDSDRTADAGAADTAVAVGVLGQVLLVVFLGVVELRSPDDLGGNGSEA